MVTELISALLLLMFACLQAMGTLFLVGLDLNVISQQ